jgi:hypothetical protein
MSRQLRLSAWLVPAGVTFVYVATLSAILAQDTDSPRQLVVAFLGLSLLAGVLIRRFYALVLPISVVALSLVSVHRLDEDPIVAMVLGLLLGVVLARAYEPSARPAPETHGLRRLVRRERLDAVIDRVRFRVDTFPRGLYQPVDSLPGRSARRGAGSESRWEAMLPVIREQHVASAVDVGAAEGYFAIQLGRSRIPAIAIERDPPAYRTALYAIRRSRVEDVGMLALKLRPENVVSVPASDCTLCLSVWHHFVRAHGLDGATEMLGTIWERTGKVLFFDTGEDEMTPDFGLPEMQPDARSWISAYLAETCAGSRVEQLGTHAAFDPSGRPCERNLFAVIRV